ncbi:MAG: GNAT family N-acetyltransferase, partial [Myxococcales bacterium]|nr:GNAT family N-acetyltransferase [Myxococcales bacterium]
MSDAPGGVRVEELGPDHVAAVEALFGPRGACGGCWCMYWRVPGGKGWRALQGAPAKAALTELIAGGEARGALAFAGDTPVGWVTYGPRLDFRRLERARTLRCDDAERVWSVPCFFIASD